jgi:hypothetical protein
MTSDQKKVVILYSVVSILVFIAVVIIFINHFFGTVIRRQLGINNASSDEADTDESADSLPTFYGLQGNPIYIPHLDRPELVDDCILASLTKVSDVYLPESLIIVKGSNLNPSVIDDDFPDHPGIEVSKLNLISFIFQ